MSAKDCILEIRDAVNDLFSESEATEIFNKVKNKLDEKRLAKEIDLSEERIAQETADEIKKIH